MSIQTFSLAVAVLATLATAGFRTGNRTAPKAAAAPVSDGKLEVFLDVGVGPALHLFPGPLMDAGPLMTGMAIELKGVAPKATIQALAKRPNMKKYRKYANAMEEISVTPLWVNLIPDRFLFASGDSLSAYGATWTFLGAGLGLIDSDFMRWSVTARLPTVSYVYMDGPLLEKSKHYWGVGASPGSNILFNPRGQWQLDVGYRHNLYIPLDGNTIAFADGRKQEQFQQGTAHMMVHYRYPMRMKL